MSCSSQSSELYYLWLQHQITLSTTYLIQDAGNFWRQTLNYEQINIYGNPISYGLRVNLKKKKKKKKKGYSLRCLTYPGIICWILSKNYWIRSLFKV